MHSKFCFQWFPASSYNKNIYSHRIYLLKATVQANDNWTKTTGSICCTITVIDYRFRFGKVTQLVEFIVTAVKFQLKFLSAYNFSGKQMNFVCLYLTARPRKISPGSYSRYRIRELNCRDHYLFARIIQPIQDTEASLQRPLSVRQDHIADTGHGSFIVETTICSSGSYDRYTIWELHCRDHYLLQGPLSIVETTIYCRDHYLLQRPLSIRWLGPCGKKGTLLAK